MIRPASMTSRLILWLNAGMVLLWIFAVVLSAFVMREEFDEVFDSSLKETSERLMPLLVEDLYSKAPSEEPRRLGVNEPEREDYLIYQLRNSEGRVLLHSHDAPLEPFDVPLAPGYVDTSTHRVYTDTAVSNSLVLQVADPLDHRREAIAESAGALFLPLIVLVPLSIFAMWVLVRRALAPLETLRHEIGARDGGHLAPIGAEDLPTELGSIATSVDRLMGRLRTALEGEREFASNSAHELRTPIAGALAQTQRLLVELPAGPARVRARGIEIALSKLSHLTEKLLQMARADAGIGRAETSVDLLPVVRLVVHDFELEGKHAGRVRLSTPRGAAAIMRRVDVDAFGIALRNLVENALLHGARDSAVEVTVDESGAISISNSVRSYLRRSWRRSRGVSSAAPARRPVQVWASPSPRRWLHGWEVRSNCGRRPAAGKTGSRR